MSDRIRDAYREKWTRFLRDVADAARASSEDASHLREPSYEARTRWAIPLAGHRKDHQSVMRALPFMAGAYAEAKTNAGRRALAEPLLAWAKTCAELLGVPLADPAPPRTPYKDD